MIPRVETSMPDNALSPIALNNHSANVGQLISIGGTAGANNEWLGE